MRAGLLRSEGKQMVDGGVEASRSGHQPGPTVEGPEESLTEAMHCTSTSIICMLPAENAGVITDLLASTVSL
jgi:hypothetical protein